MHYWYIYGLNKCSLKATFQPCQIYNVGLDSIRNCINENIIYNNFVVLNSLFSLWEWPKYYSMFHLWYELFATLTYHSFFFRFMNAKYMYLWQAYWDQIDCSFFTWPTFSHFQLKNDKWGKALSKKWRLRLLGGISKAN